MPSYLLGPLWVLPITASPDTVYSQGQTLTVGSGDFGTLFPSAKARTDLMTPDGQSWLTGYEDYTYLDDPARGGDRVDVGSTLTFGGKAYTITDSWAANGTLTLSGGGSSNGGIYIFEVSDGLATRYVGMPNTYVGFADPATLSGFTFSEPIQTGASLWPNYAGSNFGTPLCFAGGTAIAVPGGERQVDDIRPGDLVMTRDAGAQPVVWRGQVRIEAAQLAGEPALRPIRIVAGALGQGVPMRDLVVSPQHRLCLVSRVATRMFGQREVLVAARHLTGYPGISVDEGLSPVTYHHILLADHHVLVAEGAPAESLYLGKQALESLSLSALDEIASLFPGLPRSNPHRPARPIVSGRRARALVDRHERNGHWPVEAILEAV